MSTPDKPIEKWTVAELKAELKARNLSVNGLKAELVTRLQEAMAATGPSDVEAGATAEPEQVADAVPEEVAPAPENVEQVAGSEAMAVSDPAEQGAPAPVGAEDTAVEQTDVQMESQAEEKQETADGVEKQSAETAEQAAAKPVAVEEDYGPEEWEQMQIPEEWLPAPIVRVRNIPDGSSTDDVKAAVESCGLSVRNVVFEEEKKEGKQTALVRFPPLPLPWTLSEEDLATPVIAATEDAQPAAVGEGTDHVMAESDQAAAAGDGAAAKAAEPEQAAAEGDDTKPAKDTPSKVTTVPAKKPMDDGRRDGDAFKMSRFLATHLTERKIEINGEQLLIDSPPVAVTLFLGNIVVDDDDRLRADMEQYGSLERCFIMRGADGSSKGYGFVEFSIPAAATKARDALEEQFKAKFNELHIKRAARQKAAQLKLQAATPAKPAAADAKVDQTAKVEEVKAEEQAVKAEEQAAKAEAAEDVKEETQDEVVKAVEEIAKPMEEDQPQAAAAEAAETTKPAEVVEPEEEGDGKIMRAEPMHIRTVYSLFGRSLYFANFPQGRIDEKALRSLLEAYGPLNSFTVAKHINGNSKGFGFVEYKRADHATVALKAIDGQEHPPYGKLLASFQNPAKLLVGRASGGQGGQGRGRGYQGRTDSYRGRGGATGYGRGMAAAYGRGGPGVMGPQYGGHTGGYGAGGYGGRGAGYAGRGAGGYGTAGYAERYAGRGMGYGGRGAGYGAAAGGGYGQPAARGGYGQQRGGYGYAARGGYGAAGYSAQPAQGYGAGGYGGYRAPAAAQAGYGAARGSGYGASPGYAAQAGYGAAAGYAAPASTGYGASGGYASPGYGAATGYGAPAATGYGSPAAGYGQAAYDPAQKRAAEQAYGGYGATGYGAQDYKRTRY